MLRAIKGDKTIQTTVKMFRLIYQALGYVVEEDQTTPPGNNTSEKALHELSLTELRRLAKLNGIKSTTKMSAPELIALLAPPLGDESGDDEQDDDKQPDSDTEGGDDNAANTGYATPGNENPSQS